MKEFIEKLKCEGFEGFVTVKSLKLQNVAPKNSGVYMILRLSTTPPNFLVKGTGGRHKEKEPNVPIEELVQKWIADEPVLYIGKTDSALNGRLGQYMRFGSGKNVGHFGGRYIWQLADSDELVVCWKSVNGDAREVEKRMIENFKITHGGRRPFANLAD